MPDAPPRIVLDTNVLYAGLYSASVSRTNCSGPLTRADAKDDMVLELAVAAQVPPIVSFNAKDFGPASRFGIEVITPKIMLEELQ